MKRILLLLLLALSSAFAYAQNYNLGKSKDGIDDLYIMSVTTSKATKTVTVIDRIKPVQGRLEDFREKAKNEAPKEVDKNELSKLSFYKRKVQFNQPAKAYRVLEYSYFDLSGKLIQKVEIDEEDAKWLRLPKESLLEAEFNKVANI
ncbi:hypothetical protein GCM10023093_25130 [Nemorincola caseinilytica]|uniref:Uncharacterized protein n=1 Tax=Nemorincola caseinilytica TaxID=2054315 RepID=A0ABP8NMX7_9BACT